MYHVLILVSLLVSGFTSANNGSAAIAINLTKSTSLNMLRYGFTVEDASCMALNIYHEARGEGPIGMAAVAHVVMNRVNSPKFKNTPCDVIKEAKMYTNWKGNYVPIRNKCHFSWYCDGKPDDAVLVDKNGNKLYKNIESWRESNLVAVKVLSGFSKDVTHGATHYYNPHKASPKWSKKMFVTTIIGNHKFLKLKK